MIEISEELLLILFVNQSKREKILIEMICFHDKRKEHDNKT
jgi:hypothetical protein